MSEFPVGFCETVEGWPQTALLPCKNILHILKFNCIVFNGNPSKYLVRLREPKCLVRFRRPNNFVRLREQKHLASGNESSLLGLGNKHFWLSLGLSLKKTL